MGFWDRVKAAFSGIDPRPGTGYEIARWAMAPPRRGTIELLQAYSEQPLLRTIVSKIGDNVADVNWRVYQPKRGGMRQRDYMLQRAGGLARRAKLKALVDVGEADEVPDHPILALIADPSPVLTGRAFFKLMQAYWDVVGEVFIAVKFGDDGKPLSLWPISPANVLALPDYSLDPAQQVYKVRTGNATQGEIAAKNMIHVRDPDLKDPLARGVGMGFTLGDELDTDEYVARFTKNSFFNNMMPAGVIAIEGLPATNANAVKAYQESLAGKYQGPENAGKVMVTSGKVSVARLDTAFRDIQLVEVRKYLQEFVRMSYGIPPEVIGDMSSSNKATAYAAREILAEQVVTPRAELWRSELQKRLMPYFDDTAVLDFDSPVPADRDHQLAVMSTFREAYKVNEVRALSGHKPDEERGDEYFAPAPGSAGSSPGQPNGQTEPPTPPEGSAQEAANEDAKAIPPGDPAWVAQPLR
jgi:HK97 family phage portal protein